MERKEQYLLLDEKASPIKQPVEEITFPVIMKDAEIEAAEKVLDLSVLSFSDGSCFSLQSLWNNEVV